MTPAGPRRRIPWTPLVVAAVALVVSAAIFDALRRPAAPPAERSETGRLTGGLLPAPGALPGTLVFTSLADCRPQSLEFETLTLGPPGPSLECGLWAPPAGDLAAVALAPALGFRGSRLGLVRVDGSPDVVARLGIVRGEPAWSDDGRRLAWCTAAGITVVLAVDTGTRSRLEGCRPSIAPDGSVLTRPATFLAATLLRDGEVLLGEEDLARAFPADSDGPLDVVGYDVRADGLLAVVAVRFESGRRPRRLLQLWRDGRLERSILLPELSLPAGHGRLGERVEFDPTGTELAVAFSGVGRAVVVVELQSRRIVFGPVSQHGFAWSPDGVWLAHSTGEEVRVLAPGRRDSVYVLPIGAAGIAWR